MLLELESTGSEVYYVAPAFHLSAEFNKHYLSRQIVDNSFGFRLGDIGVLPDDDEHYVVFNSHTVAYRCSDDPSLVKDHMMSGLLGTSPIKVPTKYSVAKSVSRLSRSIIASIT